MGMAKSMESLLIGIRISIDTQLNEGKISEDDADEKTFQLHYPREFSSSIKWIMPLIGKISGTIFAIILIFAVIASSRMGMPFLNENYLTNIIMCGIVSQFAMMILTAFSGVEIKNIPRNFINEA
jgi:flagellar biosynthesis component FlhA